MTYKPDIVIYHGPDCLDGFGAAWAIHNKWPEGVHYTPASYEQPLPSVQEIADKHVLIVDFSYSASDLCAMGTTAASVVILDHHKSAQAALKQFDMATYQGGESRQHALDDPLALFHLLDKTQPFARLRELDLPPIIALFDMERSGAQLAWEFCHGSVLCRLLEHVADRDLWRFKLDGTREICAALASYPKEFALWDKFAEYCMIAELWQDGTAIVRANQMLIDGEVRYNTGWIRVDEFLVPSLNMVGVHASETGHALLRAHSDAPFVVTWYSALDTTEGTTHYSLRSDDSRQDVSEIAKRFGGGGHRNAAGFAISVRQGALRSQQYISEIRARHTS